MAASTKRRKETAEVTSRGCCGNGDKDDNNRGKATREGACHCYHCDCKGNEGQKKARKRRSSLSPSYDLRQPAKERRQQRSNSWWLLEQRQRRRTQRISNQKKKIVAAVVELVTATTATKKTTQRMSSLLLLPLLAAAAKVIRKESQHGHHQSSNDNDNNREEDNNRGKATREGACRCYRCDCKGNEGQKRQGREGARCHHRMTGDSQRKKGDNKGAIRGGRQSSDNDDGHRG